MIQIKDIDSSIKKFLNLQKERIYKIGAKGHYLDGLSIEITKGINQFEYMLVSPIKKGLQRHEEIQFSPKTVVELRKGKSTIYTFGHSVLVNHVTYNADFLGKISKGSITKISSVEDSKEMDDCFFRIILPVDSARPFDMNQFQRRLFKTKKNRQIDFIKVSVAGDTYELFIYTHEEKHYVVIDCKDRTSLKTFQKKCYSLLLALAVVKGDLIGNESFILSYKTAKHLNPREFIYHSHRESIKTNQPVFTSNPMSFYHDVELEREPNGNITKLAKDRLYDGIIDFPEKIFSNLATLVHKNEKIQRAALLLIVGNTATLEVRLPTYYVAIETISAHLSSGNKNKKPIRDAKIAESIKEYFIQHLTDIKNNNKFNNDDFDLEILKKNINRLDSPTNAAKLTDPFTRFGFKLLSEKAVEKILKERNIYLHGSFFKSNIDDEVFQEAFYTGLRLHQMIAFLLLKLSEFNGKIINYPEIWSHITKKEVNEDRLVMI